ncbi:triose-phosphate isomerase [Microbacterium horticulturae]|uniref:Triosephosphate isomerase n=1 Tax=Microbacterium horticulturae TaxID=3028316 RepID=A0ABY8C0M8_9MICO|nr:triose-phosphate isomerase family protein [Microbacterium sp. KACC 23027]WEG09287.1 triose-phosphate isomerase [Microbacterium sp. KACC 23027]
MSDRPAVTLAISLKLYLDIPRTVLWAQQAAEIARGQPTVRAGDVRMVALPSLPALEATRAALEGSDVQLGAQDLFWEDRGPYTGGVSGSDLRQAGCGFVEVGHAERRTVFGEDDTIVRRKLAAAVRNGLTPILCVGEDSSDLDGSAVCVAQLASALEGLTPGTAIDELVVAYEPVWAIGESDPAPVEAITPVVAALRTALRHDDRVAAASVIYGGSARPGLLTRLGREVDGLFLGRFAHDAERLEKVVGEAATLL